MDNYLFYLVDITKDFEFDFTDEQFIKKATEQDTVYTAQEFVEKFNSETINISTQFLRILNKNSISQ